MKKYRVVKAYNRNGLTVPVGTIIEKFNDYELPNSDITALSLGALEEIKPWEPKEGEGSFLVTTILDGVLQVILTTSSLTEKSRAILREGLIYPTREQAEECRKRILEAARKYKEEVLG